MRALIICFLILISSAGFAQSNDSLLISNASLLKNLRAGDSVTYYQCHVEEAVQQITTASGQTVTGKTQRYSLTEKYVVTKLAAGYSVNYYTSAMTSFPNRRFSGLKVREMPYWLFKMEKSFMLNTQDLKVLLALEKKGREAIEYDFVINKYTTNQLIIKHHKNFKQLVIDGNYILSKMILH